MTQGPATAVLTLESTFDALRAMHGECSWAWWPVADPFEVCVGAILVQNTAWANAARALERLRDADALEPRGMRALSRQELEALIRPSGQYRVKARKLLALLDCIEEAGGRAALLGLPAEELRRLLLATWGIGPETADAIVLYAARQPSFVVDAYTIRLFGRLGLAGADAGYGAWQRYFEELLPRDADLWAEWHALIVAHSKDVCRKRAPRCGDCRLADGCPGAKESGAV